jgi:PAS domain S-box-containing protein
VGGDGSEVTRAEEVQGALYRIAELAGSAQDMHEFYRAVHGVVGELMNARNFYIALYDDERQLMNWPYWADEVDEDWPEENEWVEFSSHQARGTTGYVLRTGEPQLIDYPRWRQLVAQGELELVGVIVEDSSWIGVPLKAEGRTVGVLVVQSYTKEVQYSERDKDLLAFVGQHVGGALSRARAIEETRQRNAELALINSVQEALAGELDLQAIYDVVGDKIRDIFDAQVVDIAVYDEPSGLLHFPYSIERGVHYPEAPLERIGFRRQVMETLESLLINEDVEGAAKRYENPLLSGEMPKSVLYVPLVAGGRATGVISLQNIDREHAFSDSDVQLLETLARSLSVTLENARLVHETRQRNAELALINSVQEALAGELELQAIYDVVGDKIQEIFDAQVVDIAIFDEASGVVHFPYQIERGVRFPDAPVSMMDSHLTRAVMETRAPLLINDMSAWERERGVTGVVLHGEPALSALVAPLVSGDELRGRISLQNVDRTNAFTETDVRLLTTLAGSLSVALENARLVHETRQRNAELAVINDIQAAIAGELDPQAIYDLVGDKLRAVFDAQVVSISVYDPASRLLEFPYIIERGERLEQEAIEVMGFRKHVLETREPLMINENVAEAAERYGNPLVLTGEPVKSSVFVPLLAGGTAVGVVSLQNLDRENAFTEGDLSVLTTVSGSVSVALEIARLVEETRQRVAELATVNSVGQALAEQPEVEALIELVGERVRETFEADIAYVALHDEAAGRIDFPYYYEAGERALQDPMPHGEGLTSQILDSAEPLLLNRQEHYEGRPTVGTPSRSYLGVPILVGEKAIGVISVQSTREAGRFGDADAGLLGTIAANVGVALQNARLFEEQREAERKYRELVEELPLTVYRDFPDVSATSEYISPRVETMFGYPPEAWMDSEFFPSVLHPDDRERVLAEQEGWLSGNVDRWTNEYRVLAADGRTVWVRDDAWIVKDAEGKPSRVHGFMIDITEQTLAHGEIRRQKQYFESLVDVSPVAIVVMNADEHVTGWNPAAAELFGWSTEEAIGRQIDDLVFGEDIREEGREVTREALARGRAQRIGRRSRKDGAVVDVELMLVPLAVDGKHVGYYAIYHDITELQHAREEAEAATQAKSAFLATMSHEIRTPMNAVIGMTDLLLGTELTSEQREFAEVVRSSGDALLHVIDDILDYSKIEAGKLELEHEPFDLRECVERALDIVAPRAWEKEIELGCLIDEDAPAGIVGDEARLRQVLLNLLSNAVKFTERGEVVVHVDAEPAATGSYRLELAVRDTGIGIPPDRTDRLFASFSQVDASTTRRYGGTGLGLAISKRLVDLMGGTISVESEEGEGSTFHIALTVDAAEVPARISLDDALPRLAGKRVLVVDDNATNREIVSRHARSWAMEPVAVELPSDALELITAGEHFDVAVLDMMMPGMDGIALAREVRRHRDERELPLLLLTSLGRLPQARSSGDFTAQLSKPIKASQLYNALLELLTAATDRDESVEVTSSSAVSTPLRILLAEDNAMNQTVALRLLERLGYAAHVASNGVEALSALEREPYDVVLMDVQMPELDGLEASRRIHERWPAETRPRIVAMTANALPEDREACFAAGMDDYVAKPIRAEELAAALMRAKPLRRQADASAQGVDISFDAAAHETLRELGGDDFLAEVVDAFLADAPALVATLRRALDQNDADELRRAAHTLKSNGSTLGAQRFSELCRELEQRAKSGRLDTASDLVGQVEQEYRPLEAALAGLVSAPAS